MCLPIVFQQCDFDFAGNWHAEAVEEYEEECRIRTSACNCQSPVTLLIEFFRRNYSLQFTAYTFAH